MQMISCKVDTLAPKCCKHAAKERLKVQSVANTIQLQEWFPKCCKHQYEIWYIYILCDLSSKMLGANKNKHIRRKIVTVFIFSYHEGLNMLFFWPATGKHFGWWRADSGHLGNSGGWFGRQFVLRWFLGVTWCTQQNCLVLGMHEAYWFSQFLLG